jgi:hypothetical protein
MEQMNKLIGRVEKWHPETALALGKMAHLFLSCKAAERQLDAWLVEMDTIYCDLEQSRQNQVEIWKLAVASFDISLRYCEPRQTGEIHELFKTLMANMPNFTQDSITMAKERKNV